MGNAKEEEPVEEEPGWAPPSGLIRLTVSEARAAAQQAGIKASLEDQPIWHALLVRPDVASSIYRLVTAQLFNDRLSPRLRELAIMRIAWVTGSSFEWTQHWHLAQRIGIPEDLIRATRNWSASSLFDARDRCVLAAADEISAIGAVSKATWKRMAQLLEDDECIDVTLVLVTWSFASAILRSFDVPLPDSMRPWPPDGRSPGD
jgi:alkylhydroperoxidase family enzyme